MADPKPEPAPTRAATGAGKLIGSLKARLQRWRARYA